MAMNDPILQVLVPAGGLVSGLIANICEPEEPGLAGRGTEGDRGAGEPHHCENQRNVRPRGRVSPARRTGA